jgi:CRISPR system Cascade subunit CasA
MNLVTGEWIPVMYEAGEHRLVSLDTLYRDAEQIRDLCATPPQRIALMRLLICITQAALDGPQDEGDWQTCRSQVVPRSIEYLQAHKEEFDLHGDRPFLQVKALKTTNNAVLDKLDFGLASGNNAVLFDHGAGPEGRPQNPGWAALRLLTYQAFSPGGRIGVTDWPDVATSPTSEHAPCVQGSALHTLVRGETLLDSVRMNLLTRRCIQELTSLSWGQPIWEVEPRSPGEKALKDLTRTYLGRLVPLSRAILLDPAGRKTTLVNGLAYPRIPECREPSATVMLRKTKTGEKHVYLRVDPAKHPWRELGSLLCFSQRDQPGGALALQHLDPSRETLVDIWTGGLAADPRRAGEIVDTAEWTFAIPQSML